jgi:hypothetical protein
MKKIYKISLLLLGFIVTFSAAAQSLFQTENFDALNSGDYVAVELSPFWATWDDLPGTSQDALVSNLYSNSSPNSMRIVEGNDVVLYIKSDRTRLTEGFIRYRHYMYVPSDSTGYFNLQAEQDEVWAFEAYVNDQDYTGDSYIYYGDYDYMDISAYTSTNQWMLWEIEIDLNNDVASLSIDNVFIVSWTWSDCGSSDFHAVDYWGGEYNYYQAFYDDIAFDHVYAGPDITSCGTTITLSNASEYGYDDITWTTSSAAGYFSDDKIVNAVYNPSAQDIIDGSVTLTMTATAGIVTAVDEVVITFYETFAAGAIQTSGETICYNTIPSVIGSATAASGGDGDITYSWRSSADGFTTAISGATGASYTPTTPLTASTSFRRYANDGACTISPEQSSGTWVVTVSEQPEFINVPSNIQLNTEIGMCSARVSWTTPTVTNSNCLTSLVSNHSPNSHFPVGVTTITYTATDVSSNIQTASFTVTVVDNEKPRVIGMPIDLFRVSDPGSCEKSVSWPEPAVKDNCGVASVTSTHHSGDIFLVGETTVTYTFTDIHGNILTRSFVVTIHDGERPTIEGIEMIPPAP